MSVNGAILVTPRSVTKKGHPSLQRLEAAGYTVVFCTPGQQPDEAELLRLLPDCVGYLAGVEKVTARVLAAAPRLKVISRNGTGVDNVDLDAAGRQGIAVCRAEGANARGVAELTLALTLALVRSVPFSDAGIKAGGWQRRPGIELAGRTLGLLGCGRIGRLVSGFALALGMQVRAYDLYPDPAYAAPGFNFAGFDETIAAADILSLHCPMPRDGRPLLTAEVIARLKPGVYVVNTARAGLLDEAAVRAALEAGRIAGLATDVFPEEPPRDRALAGHDRVIATPHIGGLTDESVTRSMDVAVDNLLTELKR
jgi:phosphoglycerate dehydrogenase-like enzyme